MERSGHEWRGRDGCRVPIPWSGHAPPFGFGPPGCMPWLPQPAGWDAHTVEAQADDRASMLELYRTALRIRRTHPGLAGEELTWLASPPGTLVFERGAGLRCAVNVGGEPYRLPPAGATLVASEEIVDDVLPAGAAAWFVVADGR